MSAPDAMAGKKGSCPKCGAPVVAPPGGPPAQPEAPAALDELRKAVEGPAAAPRAAAAKQPRQRPVSHVRAMSGRGDLGLHPRRRGLIRIPSRKRSVPKRKA